MPYEATHGRPHRYRQTSAKWLQPPAPPPGLKAEKPAFEHALRRVRAAAVRAHWDRAKRLSPSITDTEIANWFSAAFDESAKPENLPRSPLRRILWLIETRDCHLPCFLADTRLRMNAAIWKEITRLKKYSQKPGLKRQTSGGVIGEQSNH